DVVLDDPQVLGRGLFLHPVVDPRHRHLHPLADARSPAVLIRQARIGHCQGEVLPPRIIIGRDSRTSRAIAGRSTRTPLTGWYRRAVAASDRVARSGALETRPFLARTRPA
ncbi:MAG: hypothetical protein ACK559_40190, partial [bacterium]